MSHHKKPKAEPHAAGAGNQIAPDHSGDSAGGLPPIVAPPQPPQAPAPQNPAANDPCKFRENLKLGIEILGLTALIVYTIFSILQWAQIRWTNRLTREALNGNNSALQQTLGRMDWQAQETHEIAKQTLAQQQQTTKIANETHDLAIATRNESSAAKSSADTAAAELTMANRPWVTVDVEIAGPLQHIMFPGTGGEQLRLPLEFHYRNTGLTPATAVTSNVRIVQTRFGYLPFADNATLSEVQAFMAKGGKPIAGTNSDADLRDVCKSDITPPKIRSMDGFNWGRLVAGRDTYDDFIDINTPMTQFDHPGRTPKGYVSDAPMPLTVVVCTTYGFTFNDETHQVGAVYILGRKNPASPGGMEGINPFDKTPIPQKDLGLIRDVAHAGFSK